MEAPSQQRCGQEGSATFSLELLSRIQQAGFPQKSREGPRMVMLSTSVSFSLACNSLEERPVPYLSGGSQSNRAGMPKGSLALSPTELPPPHSGSPPSYCSLAGGRILEIRKDSLKRSRYRVGESGGAPLTSKEMSRKSLLGDGCWEESRWQDKSCYRCQKGLEERVAAARERPPRRHPGASGQVCP